MRRIIFLPLLAISLLSIPLNANCQREAWAKEGNYSAIAVDLSGQLLAAQDNTLKKFDTSGNVLWLQNYSHSFYSLCYTPNGSIYCSGGNKLTKLSPDGQIVWEVANNDGTVTAATNDAIYIGSVFSFTKYSAAGVAQFTKTLSVSTPVGTHTISADKVGNIHLNLSTQTSETVYYGPRPVSIYADSRIVLDGNGSLLSYQAMFPGGTKNYSTGYKARNNETDFLYTSYSSFISNSNHVGYFDGCAANGPCLTVSPVNPDYDKLGRKYFAGTIVVGTAGPSCTNASISVCGLSTTGKLNKVFVSAATGLAVPNFDGNTRDYVSYIAADPNGRSLYVLGSWSANVSDSKFSFAGSQFNTPGTMLLRYSIDAPASSPLPVVGLVLAGKSVNKTNVLSWQTLSENDNDRFVLERSNDGTQFVVIGTILSKALNGTSSTSLTYNFQDNNFLKGITYYRVKQVDKNGRVEYSNQISLKNLLATSIFISPSPVKQTAKLKAVFDNSGILDISIFDVAGREVIHKITYVTAGINYIDINMSSVAPGKYFVRTTSARSTETINLIKQ